MKTTTKKAPSKATAKKATKAPTKPKDTKETTTSKAPGVIATMVALLRGATKAKPIAKADLIAKLEKAFPDRPNVSKTVGCQLGARIEKEQGIKLHKGEDGYWAT